MDKKKQKALGVNSWKPLEIGDVVDLVAPGFACKKEELKASVKFLRSWGLVPRYPKDIFGKDYLCSNTDQYRFHHLIESLYDIDSAAVWCLRGGYGALRILPQMAKMKPPKKQKVFLGYSDATTVHQVINDHWGWASLHGPMMERAALGKLTKGDESTLKKVLFGHMDQVEFKGLRPLNEIGKKTGSLGGAMAGGNLATLVSSMGSQFQPNGRGKIVFFEEIGERGHQVDRMLTQLELSGYFKGARAVVFGDFIGGAEPVTGKFLWKDVMKAFAGRQKIPVFHGLPMGHGARQRVLPFGSKATLKISSGRAHLEVCSGFKK